MHTIIAMVAQVRSMLVDVTPSLLTSYTPAIYRKRDSLLLVLQKICCSVFTENPNRLCLKGFLPAELDEIREDFNIKIYDCRRWQRYR